TSVLVERFVQAVLEDGCAVDSMLAITFTEKAAAQLTARVRRRFLELGDEERAREAEAAWISTIHGFCARLLRTHALAAGLDPEFRVLDALEAERLAIDAFDKALGDFVGTGQDPGRLALLAAYTPDKLADMVRTAYGHLRSQGQRCPRLPEMTPPRDSGQRRALLEAVGPALAEIGAAEGTRAVEAVGRLDRCTAVLEALGPDDVHEPAELDKLKVGTGANVLKGPACDAYREAYDAYLAFCLHYREHNDHVLVRELMALHDGHYAELKRGRSGLDFDDLELVARDLLRAHPGIRDQYRERFSHVMVDEFQDTNPLQNELLELLEHGNLFRVGDERQSIYGFRHADVRVFRRHLAEARAQGRAERMTVNFRSRGEVLDAVDLTFEGLWGDDFDALVERPGARDQPPRAEPCVELLVTDRHKDRWEERFPPGDGGEAKPFGDRLGSTEATIWRAAEARLLAKRIDELAGPGRPFAYSDCVMLLRATTHMGVYERALEDRGVPTHVLGGRGYWAQQQVADLRAYLAALANPLDELALHSVLASPLGGLSLDTLVVLATRSKCSGPGGIWRVMTEDEELPGLIGGQQLELLRAFCDRFREDRVMAPRLSLETLIDRAVTRSGYDRHLLALPAGDRRMANVRKLMRMAREFEADEGRDLRRFIDFVAERDLVQAGEGQAPLEAEDLDAVRLMTIHRAKGLEFPLVCVADLGKTGREDDSALRVTDDGRLGMRLASLSGVSVDSAEMERIKQEQKAADEEEERRIFYVAATRAEEHLVLSGATDLVKLQPEADLTEPMRWLWRALAPGLEEMGPEEVSVVEYEGRELRVACRVLRPGDVDVLLPEADRLPVAPEPEPPGLEALTAPALAAVPVPEALPVSRLSYSGLAAYRRCGYRFYLERALRLPPPDDGPARAARGGDAGDAMPATVRGTVVHQLLEEIDFTAPAVPGAERVGQVIEALGQPVRAEEVEDVTGLVAGVVGSALAQRIGAAERVHAELPFAFTLDTGGGRSLLVDGIVDVHAREGDAVLVVDYKSDRLEGAEPAERVEGAYAIQQLVYALAALRSGAARAEVAYCFLERPDDPVTRVYEAAEAGALEAELRELTAGVSEGRFEPTAHPHRGLCADCPG
ncbi:MAG TPA: UvrD-helicase domain-containing protein, partial [Thermoleophilaceae bacterium]|nr:UvrD-helicase domain-containing protein [Thermoleophilaceae bacterium]